MAELSERTGKNCPRMSGGVIPTRCDERCARAYMAWWERCSTTASRLNADFDGQLEQFAGVCQRTLDGHEGH